MDHLHAKRGYIYIIGCVTRPGVILFSVKLEFGHYPPESDLNDEYNIFRIQYSEAMFCIIEIPATDYAVAEKIAGECNLKLVNGKPYNAMTGEFSLACDSQSCYTLETVNHTLLPCTGEKLQELLHDQMMSAQQIAGDHILKRNDIV